MRATVASLASLALAAAMLASGCERSTSKPPESAASAPTRAASASPRPAPAATEPPGPVDRGELTAEETDAVLSGAVADMQGCYLGEAKATPAFHPRLLVTLHVMPDGGVGAVRFDKPVPKPFADCMTRALGKLRFRVGFDQNVDFPLDLTE